MYGSLNYVSDKERHVHVLYYLINNSIHDMQSSQRVCLQKKLGENTILHKLNVEGVAESLQHPGTLKLPAVFG